MAKQTANRKIGLAASCALILLAGACKTTPDELPPAPGYEVGGAAGYDPYGANGTSASDPYGANGGEGAGYGNAAPAGGPGSNEDFIRSVPSDRVYFDTDRYNIDNADIAILQAQAQWMMRYPATSIVIEGHADERGTRDYNLALGERRANSAKQYLASLGVPASRISTVSYGKERPQAMGSDAQSWAQNRRAVTVTVQ